MNKFGLSANLMSLGGLAIAIGMMVDAAIVMVENCDRHLKLSEVKGQSKVKVIAEACHERIN
jgi:cobalt-zinc-cadmium resistance protein CzcA